jgi:hypothetical protein
VEKPVLTKMQRFLRIFLKTFAGLLGTSVALFVLMIAVNWSDEELTPGAKALLTAPPNPYKPEENLYLALLGLDAPQGESPVAAGRTRVAVYEDELAAGLKNPEYVFPHLMERRSKRLPFEGRLGFCRPLQDSCYADVDDHRDEIETSLKANRELFDRYSRLHGMKGYYETGTPSFYMLVPYAPPEIRQLVLADIALRMKADSLVRQKAAFAGLADDVRTWRRMLAGSGSLISKMVAISNLQGDYALLADVIADPDAGLDRFSPEIGAMLDLSNGPEWKIGAIFAYEYRADAYLWEQMRAARKRSAADAPADGDYEWWELALDRIKPPFLKINATQNLHARVMLQLEKVADAAPRDYFAAWKAYQNWLGKNVELGLNYVYNPTGKSLVAIGADAYGDYPLRAWDAAAFQRLVRLGYEIRRQRIGDKAIPSFMQQHPEWATHPVDGRLFVWDEKKREIAVQPLGRQPKDRRFGIPVWSAVP